MFSRAAKSVLLFAVRFHQFALSPFNLMACKFYPSCSHYAAEAITTHGAMRGSRLALARLWRCRPFTRGGFDPVPDFLGEAHDGCHEDSPTGARA
jgi:putative membrane protein insertion efficiency factor